MGNTSTRFYLSVPYAEKDQAKTLGAKWDAAQKKWYVPAGLDINLFERWNPGDPLASDSKSVPPKKLAHSASCRRNGGGSISSARTEPEDKDFVPYSGDAPPWE